MQSAVSGTVNVIGCDRTFATQIFGIQLGHVLVVQLEAKDVGVGGNARRRVGFGKRDKSIVT